jgi:protoporphyrinogen oxidase
MSLAQRLRREGHEVTIFEGSDSLGGLAAPWTLGDVSWDRHYHVTLLSDSRTREMYEAIGLGDDAKWVETKTGYYGPDEQLRSVSNVLEFFSLPGLSLVAKVRLGGTIFLGSKIRNGERMQRITVERWLRRWSGSVAFETFWKPLLRAKMGDEYEKASAAFIWATVQRLYAARRSGLKKEMFGYVSGGYAKVCTAFAQWFDANDVTVALSTPVASVHRTEHGLVVATVGGNQHFDRVVITTAAPIAARIAQGLLPAERARLESVDYVGIVCASLLLRRPLAEYYLTYITDPATPFTAVVEMTAFIDPAEVGGHTLVYLPKYASPSDPIFTSSDDEVLAHFREYLARMYPTLTDDDVLAARVSRVPHVFAIPSLDYSNRAPSIGCSVEGLFIAGSANLPFSTLNVNDTLSLVDRVLAEAVLSDESKEVVK